METLGYEAVQFSPLMGCAYVDIERQLRAAAKAGFHWFAVDIWSIRAFEASGRQLDELASIASSSGLDCGQLQSLFVPGGKNFERAVTEFTRSAQALRPATVQVIAESASDKALEQFRYASEQIRRVAPEAVFAMEYTPIQPINSIQSSLEFIRASGVERFGVNLDTWHFFEGNEDWADLEAIALDDIAHLQFSDHGLIASRETLRDEMMHHRMLPGTGRYELERFLSIVRDIGYRGRAGVEILSETMRSMTPEDYAAEVHRHARTYWGDWSVDS